MRIIKKVFSELKHHIPFTFGATLIAILFVWILYQENILVSESIFHIVHPLHLFASSMVSAAIFYKYKQNFVQAFFVGIISAIFIGSLSDIILPYLGSTIIQLKTNFHLPLIEKPFLIFSTVILGSTIGIATKFTKFPHFIHVFLSIFASLFYILAFSSQINLVYFILISFIIFIAVFIPCCVSDIIFPLLFIKKRK